MVDRAVVGYEPFFDVKLVVFPEFAHAAPIYETVAELRDRLAVPIPNEHTDRYVPEGRERGIYIQTGTFLEVDDRWPGVVFNTTCLIGPGRALEPLPQGESRGFPGSCTPARTTCRATTSPLSRGRDRDRPARRRDLLRLALPRGHPGAGPGRGRGLDSRLGLHGPLGSDAAARLVDALQSGPGRRELRLRRGGQSGSECRQLSAVLLARRAA